MPQVTVTINGRKYPVACDEGEEDHVRRLAEYVDRRVAELVGKLGQVGDALLLVLTSLLIADELTETHDQLAALRDAGERDRAAAETGKAAGAALEKLAGRIEAVAARLAND